MANSPASATSPDTAHGLSMTQISHAIGLARITLIVGLVFLHYGNFPNSLVTPFHGLDMASHPFVTWFNSAVLFFFFSAVPLLSMVSGWLFFSFLAEDAWASIKRRMHRRFTSLYLALLYGAFLAFPHASAFSHSTRLGIDFALAGWRDYANAVLGVTREPVAFQFWFVRDLFVTALASPLWWFMIRRFPRIGTALIGIAWISGWNMMIFFRPDVPFFFYLGALIHQKHLSLTVPLRTTLIAVALYVTLAGLRALAPCVVYIPDDAGNPYWLDTVTRLMRLVGVIGCWGVIYRLAQTSRGITLSGYGGLAFFLHSAHWPLLAIIKAAVWHFMPGNNGFWMLVHYVTSVLLTVAVGLGFALALARSCPRMFALMNGGRLLGQLKEQPVKS
jgi:succinoglycan biosynthesis protein ExoH